MIKEDDINIGLEYYDLDTKILNNEYDKKDLLLYSEILLLLKNYNELSKFISILPDELYEYKYYIYSKIKSKNTIVFYNRVLSEYRLQEYNKDYEEYLNNLYNKSNDSYYLYMLGVKFYENNEYEKSKNIFLKYLTIDTEYYAECMFYLLFISTMYKDNNMYNNCLNSLKNVYKPEYFNIDSNIFETKLLSYNNNFNASGIYIFLKDIFNYTKDKVKLLNN